MFSDTISFEQRETLDQSKMAVITPETGQFSAFKAYDRTSLWGRLRRLATERGFTIEVPNVQLDRASELEKHTVRCREGIGCPFLMKFERSVGREFSAFRLIESQWGHNHLLRL